MIAPGEICRGKRKQWVRASIKVSPLLAVFHTSVRLICSCYSTAATVRDVGRAHHLRREKEVAERQKAQTGDVICQKLS